MPQYKDKFSSSGGINKDAAIDNIKPGDYPDALDISFLSDFTGGSGNITPNKGNEYVFDTGSVSAQNKKYRLYISDAGTGTPSYRITFFKTDTTTALTAPIVFSDSLANARIAIINAAAAVGYAVSVTNNTTYLLIEFQSVSYYDYFIKDTGIDAVDQLYVYQEAIDVSLVGENRTIGSFDLLGDLFIWSTSQTELPSVLGVTISSVTQGIYGTDIITTTAHGLVLNQRVLAQGFEGYVEANGIFIVGNVTTLGFTLMLTNAPTAAWVSGTGTITINPFGIGEIGVAQKVQVTQAWTYTRLLRSKEWNWNTKKQFDTYCEQTATNNNLYGTNDYTPPMVFYYQTAYSTDGALSFNGGLYEYGTIFDETRLFLSVLNTQIEFTEQLQGGGALTAGNKRYAVRALTETATATDWSDVTNPINVYAASTAGNPEQIIGNITGVATGKINVLTITNIQVNTFKYIEVACVEYFGTAASGYIVNRYLITGSTMVINHTGNETTAQLDINELGLFSIAINTARNIRAIDNRLIVSNLTTVADEDLNFVATNIRHSLSRKFIRTVDVSQLTGVNYGEYQDPENVNQSVGYMIDDTYRFSVKFRYKEGGAWTKNYWVDDIRIDNYLQGGIAFNRGNPFGDNRRNVGLNDLGLTTGISSLVPYIRFTNVDFNYITASGIRLGNVFDAVSFERAECVPEILFTGIARMGVTEVMFDGFNNSTTTNLTFRPPMFILSTAEDYNALPAVPNPQISNVTSIGYIVERNYMSIYSPDILLGNIGITFQQGDEVINYGSPDPAYVRPTIPSSVNFFIDFEGQTANNMSALVPTTHAVSEAELIENGSTVFMNSTSVVNYSNIYAEISSGGGSLISTDFPVNFTTGVAIYSTTPFTNVSGDFFDYGYYYVQYRRTQLDKYGDIAETEYITCGNLYLITTQTTTTSFNVLGGDTFTQKTFFKISNSVSLSGNQAFSGGIGNDGLGFISQNRVNSQMRQASVAAPLAPGTQADGAIFPFNTTGQTVSNRILNWLNNAGWSPELLAYDIGYNILNSIDYHASFDENLIQNNDQPTRIRWSPVKPQNAIADLYRAFLPFDFHDLDNSFGEITHHDNRNGELVTWQPKKVQRQFFNTRGTLDVRGVSDVLIGDGSVMSRDGQTINNFGCSSKWSIIKGKSQGGNDVFYWIDIINKQALRLGSDGTVGISTIKGLMSFLANNLLWVSSVDTPADNLGIHGYWSQRFKEAVWIVRAVRSSVATPTGLFGGVGIALNTDGGIPMTWASGSNYLENSIVAYTPTTFSTFNQTGEFYRSLINNNNLLPTDPAGWELIPHTNNSFYNEYSICYNEVKDRFTARYSPLQKITLQWQDTFLVPRPVATESRHYLGNSGEYAVWFKEGTSELTSEPFCEVAYNKDVSLSKIWYALIAVSGSVPYKIEFITLQHQTTVLAADFKQYINEFAVAIPNDTLNTVPSPIGYSKLIGQWIICRFYFATRTFNSLDNLVIKFTDINPSYRG